MTALNALLKVDKTNSKSNSYPKYLINGCFIFKILGDNMTNPVNPVTVFFRDSEKWRSPDSEPAEIISDRDVTNLYDLSMCILQIRKRAKEENRKTTYDNPTLDSFMDEFTLMIDEISRKKNIKDFISHPPNGSQLEVSTRVQYY